MSVKSRWFLSGCPFWLSACMLYHQKTKVLKRGRMMRIDVIKILLQGYAHQTAVLNSLIHLRKLFLLNFSSWHNNRQLSQGLTKCNSQKQAGILISQNIWCTRHTCQAFTCLLSCFCYFENLKTPACWCADSEITIAKATFCHNHLWILSCSFSASSAFS